MNPNEDLKVPAWINEQYFVKIFQLRIENFVKIEKFRIEAATGPGDNFGSIMLRVLITLALEDGTTTERAFILKTMLETESALQFAKFLGQFPKEKEIYDTLMPQLEEVYKDVGVFKKFGPHCLHTEETPKRITLILEDLKKNNFHNTERLEGGLNMTHMRAALKKLGQFHSASVMRRLKCGEFGKQFQVGLVSERSRNFFEERSGYMLKAFALAMQQWNIPGSEEYIQKLPTSQQYVDQLISLGRIDPKAFNVLNHGDFWSNNIMFKYQQCGEISETLFVDFQMCKYGPPTYDLYLLILTSAALEIKIQEFDNFLQIYQHSLSSSLKLLGYTGDIPSLNDVRRMMKFDRFYAFFMVSGYLPIILMPPDVESQVERRLKGGDDAQKARMKSLLNPTFIEQIKQLLPWLCDEGFLDI